MYPITNEVKALFEANEAKVVRITGSTVRILPTDIAVYSGNTLVYQSGDSKRLKLYSGSSEIYDNQGTKTVILYSGDKPIFINDEAGMPIQLNITSSDVRQGDFSIDRYSCNGQLLEIGTAIASEFTLQLDNVEGQFDGVVFEGVELFVEIGISDPADSDAEIIWVPCGYFTCDHQPRRLNTLSITALDRMMRFDKKPTSGSLTLPKTVAQLVAAGCAACNVALGQSLSGLPNANYSVTALPDNQDGISWRDIIRWCAGLMGTNAWIDWNGELRFSWYNNDTGYVSTTDNRFSSDLYENPIIITGVKFTDTDEANTTYIAGTEDYAIDVSDNGFINADNADALLPNIYLAMNGFAYTPFSASAIAAPYLWPMDRVTFTDKNGKGHVSVLTNVNLSVNGSTDIAAVGESAEFYSYGKSSSFTAQQQATLRGLRRVVGTDINDAVESATAQITGAQGGYVRFMYDANGVMTEILIMNTSDIATATKVWRWNQGGFGYSSNGYQGPYTTAITQDGAIVATFITAGILNAAIVKTGILGDAAGKNYWNMLTGEFSLSGDAGLGESTVGDVLDAVDAAISNVDVEYAQNQSTTTAPTSGWSTTAPAWRDGYYIWQRTATTTNDGTTYSEPTCISGRDGVDGQTGPQGPQGATGATGIGVSAVVEQYYLSTSSSTQSGGSWSTDQPQWVSGKYIWTRSHVTWTDNTTTDTTPVLAQAINGANSAASSAQSAVTTLDNSLNQQGVFNRLTNNGQTQGIYLNNGLLYINASYIGGGIIDGTVVQAKLLNIIDGNNTVIASFSDKIILGKASSHIHTEIGFNLFKLVDKNNNTFLSLGEAANSDDISELIRYDIANGVDNRYTLTYGNSFEVVSATVDGVEKSYSFPYALNELVFNSIPSDGSIIIIRYKVKASILHYDLGIPKEINASGNYSVAEGYNILAPGKASHAEGEETIAAAWASHAEGYTTKATTCYGAHAEGAYTRAYGGISDIAPHAEGHNTTAYGDGCHAEGNGTSARGRGCHAEGYGTIAYGIGQHVAGSYNIENRESSGYGYPQYIEIIGNGRYVYPNTTRSNARTLTFTGNEWIAGTLTQASDSRLKEESGEVPDLSDIRARRFKWNDKKGTHDDLDHIGYFAQDVEKIAPYLVQEDAMGYKSLDYIALLCAKVEYLERRVQQLENEVKRHDD